MSDLDPSTHCSLDDVPLLNLPPLNTIGRFNYWDFYDVNPLRQHPLVPPSMLKSDAHRYLSEQFRTLYKQDPEAIFAYMGVDLDAFTADWVNQQMRRWKAENTEERAAQLHRLMTSYIGDRRGHTNRMALLDTIWRDQAIFHELIRLNREKGIPFWWNPQREDGCFSRLASQYDLTEYSIATIYRHYMTAAREALGETPPALLPRSFAPREQRLIKEAERAIGWPERFSIPRKTLTSWDDVWPWFDNMAENLARLWD